MTAPPARRRARGGMYPLWLGIVALGGITAWWVVAVEGPPTSDTPVAEVADAAMPTDAAPPVAEPSRLVWTIADRDPVTAEMLDACLARDGMPRALAVGGERTLITHPDRIRPIAVIAEDGGLRIDTPVEEDARLAAALHVSLTACAYTEGATVVDPVLDRRLTGSDWPQLGETGGLPIHHLLAVESVDGGLRTRGMARLARPELAIAFSKGDRGAARRFLLGYAADQVVAAPDAPTITRGGAHPARKLTAAEARAAGWWIDPADDVLVLAHPEAEPVQPVALPKPSPGRAAPRRAEPTRARPTRTRPTPRAETPRPTEAPPPTRPQTRPKPDRPAPKKKDLPFRPAYH